MPKFSNRLVQERYISDVWQDEDTIGFIAAPYTFVLPLNPLTAKIYADPQYPYKLEFHQATNILAGVFAPDGSTFYRLSDAQVQALSRTPTYTARLVKEGMNVDLTTALETMLNEVDPPFMERLQGLPEQYVNQHYVYETKVSYLASQPSQPLVFDPTPQELMHAMSLQFGTPTDIPGFFL